MAKTHLKTSAVKVEGEKLKEGDEMATKKQARAGIKSETVKIRRGKVAEEVPRFGFRDTPKGVIKKDRVTGDIFFIHIDTGKERRIKIGKKSDRFKF